MWQSKWNFSSQQENNANQKLIKKRFFPIFVKNSGHKIYMVYGENLKELL